jgi:hypothetical protein
MICPLQKIEGEWSGYSKLFAKRLDLVGGNKGFRFQQFFKEHPRIETLVALSNPGAHTFHVLQTDSKMQFLFLEQQMTANPYTEARRSLYLNQENIKVIQAPFWQQLLRFLYYKYFGGIKYSAICIGGHIDLKDANPYEDVFKECCEQISLFYSQPKGVDAKEVIHLFPIASGNMADCFLAIHTDNKFVAVTTGGKRTFSYLNFKYRSTKNISLHKPLDYSYEVYKEKAKVFYDKSNFWLDPTHTIHLLDLLDQELLPKDAIIVMWITCPLVEKLYD